MTLNKEKNVQRKEKHYLYMNHDCKPQDEREGSRVNEKKEKESQCKRNGTEQKRQKGEDLK